MNTTETRPDLLELQDQTDSEAVMRHVMEGTPIDPELKRRVEERANQITEDIRRKHGFIDVDKLIRDARDDA